MYTSRGLYTRDAQETKQNWLEHFAGMSSGCEGGFRRMYGALWCPGAEDAYLPFRLKRNPTMQNIHLIPTLNPKPQNPKTLNLNPNPKPTPEIEVQAQAPEQVHFVLQETVLIRHHLEYRAEVTHLTVIMDLHPRSET